MDYVAGYCVINDVSERAFQLEGTGTWDKGKGCDTFGPTGPWLVTKDEIENPHQLKIWLEVDGHRYQDGNTNTMIFDDCTNHCTHQGLGLGQKPPVYLKAGQVMRLGIEGLGEQQQKVVNAE
ncbi:hypothetical protein FQR65_LT19035 [Abscondita terminalis]|nr:hypothetical protein FQR65_LT19035 [Abscondita terminalis]